MIQHTKPSIGENEVNEVIDTIRSGWLINGPKTEKFENEFKKYIGMKHALGTNTGTSALHLALQALDIKEGAEVILPSYVCTSVLDTINYTRANPILADVKEDGNIDINDIKIKITDNTKAIIVPHMFGTPADVDEIIKLNIPVIEDCAHSIGSEINNKKIGSFGTISIFSFYASKMMCTVQGGMILTNSDSLINKIKDSIGYDKEDYKIRYNYAMSDIQASFGLVQLKKIDRLIEKRRQIAKTYNEAFKKLDITIKDEENKKKVYYRYIIKHKEITNIIKELKNKKIVSMSPVYKPLHSYMNTNNFPNTDKAHNTFISIPIYPDMTNIEIEHVIQSILEIIDKKK